MTAKESSGVQVTLIAALLALPIRRAGSGKDAIPYELVIPRIARQLTLLNPDSPTSAKRRSDQERLDKARSSVNKIVTALEELPKPVLEKLNFNPLALRQLL